ncbi:Retrovirus-related Pol poly from transposon [Labeo rohita]|uniref:Retrovirus-related Pol poly from transposon n=1 Tax=Labeo rohita TaxID=84645 RepID=A0A498P169_LABRO|nr:Retrovirus-related Pol poly from transposon [Labeo rohita]
MAVFSSDSGLCFIEANESFTDYEERFAQFVEANGIEKSKQRAVFLSVVGAKTFSLLTDLLAPKRQSETPLTDILKALRDIYVPKKNVLSERYSFRARKQLNGESLAEYVAALKGLASTCEFGASLEEQLRDQLVYGICSKDLRARLLSAAYSEQLTWSKVLDTVNNFECTVSSLKAFQHAPMRTDSVIYAKPEREPPGAEERTPGKGRRDKSELTPCYRCLVKGHAASNCKYKDFQCRACDKKGHLERACRNATSKKTTSRAANKPAWERETKYISTEGGSEGEIAPRTTKRVLCRPSKAKWSADQLSRPPDSDASDELNQPTVEAELQQSETNKDYGLFALKGNSECVNPYMVMIRCNGVKVKMEVDTGAAMSIISETLYRKRFKRCKLQPC